MQAENKLVVLNGIVKGRTVELERETGLPDGQKVVLLLSTEESLDSDLHAEESLRAIYQMRHSARSIINP